MLRLFFENYEIELNENIQIAITKQFEDITNPTVIINDYSKTIRIPSTTHNDKIFGHLYNVDKLIVEGNNKLMGVYFNPYKKIDFRLQWGDDVIMVGYAKNISVDKGYYNITLNGELGKVFQEMKKITFDTTTEDTKYLIEGSNYVEETIYKDLIHKLWTTTPRYSTSLEKKYTLMKDFNTGETIKMPNSLYRVQDYIGFVPNNSFDDGFDYKTFELKDNKSKTFVEVLDERAAEKLGEGKTYVDATGISADNILENGMLPREIGEYRSYYQLPYIYFNKLFRIFLNKAKSLTGYDMELDSTWFNEDNPYWSKLVYMLSKFNIKDNLKSYEEKTSNDNLINFVLDNSNGVQANPYTPTITTKTYSVFQNDFLSNITEDFNNKKIDIIRIVKQPLPITLIATTPYNIANKAPLTSSDTLTLNPTAEFRVDFRLLDSTGNVVQECKNSIVSKDNSFGAARFNGVNKIEIDSLTYTSNNTWSIDVNLEFDFLIERSTVGNSFTIEVAIYTTTNNRFLFYNTNTNTENLLAPKTISFDVIGDKLFDLSESTTKRSGFKFTLNDLWNNEFNPFDEILNYCKQFRIGVFCDYVKKKLVFKPLSIYFKDYTIEDWTDKIDYSKDFHIEPITFHNKYILFNYKKYDTELNKKYNEKYGCNFGEYRLSTDYEFNTDTKEIFDYSKIAIPSTDIILSWGNLYSNLSITYTLPAEITAYNKDKDNKNIDMFGCLLFYKGLINFDTTSGMRAVKITDDTFLQTLNKTYFYTQDADDNKKISVASFPLLDIVSDNCLITYTTPKENYTYENTNYDNTNGVYSNFWENYLNERYNINNKIVTCYVYLTQQDYANFEFNKFVIINNQLFFVNKIYDYNMDDNNPTKVDLITIQNINGYTQNKFNIV